MQQSQRLVLIDRNVLGRDCLGRVLRSFKDVDAVAAFASVDEWMSSPSRQADSAIFVQRGELPSPADLQRDINQIHAIDSAISVILISDDENPKSILRSLDMGCKGYIPSSFGIDVAFEAIHLVSAGGVFVPAASLIAYRRAMPKDPEPKTPHVSSFTARQEAVVQLIRQGKSNKTIANELNMRESTVKVHIRNIMKTIKAKNRTEVAVRTSGTPRGSDLDDT